MVWQIIPFLPRNERSYENLFIAKKYKMNFYVTFHSDLGSPC
jgi:hypothetical protein